MINKIFKTIHNKFSIFFKFVFFIRYLFAVFFVATLLFLVIPHFFDYKKKEKIIYDNLFQTYDLKINQTDNIKYSLFPVPHLEIINSKGNLFSKNISIKINNLKLYPSFASIYNFNNYQIKKIELHTNEIQIDTNLTKKFTRELLSLKKKILFKNLILQIQDNKINLVVLKNINFKNYGFKKNNIDGEIFGRKFKIKFLDDYKKINFELSDTGISAEVNFEDDKKKESFIKRGTLKSKLLSSNLKFDFIYDENSIKINDLFFRDKKLSFNSNGNLKIKPFFEIILNSNIKNIKSDIFSNLKLSKLLAMKDFIKKFNSRMDINYESRKFSNNLINDISLKTKLEIGRLSVSKISSIINSNAICKGEVNLLEDFPILNFDCSLVLPDKKKFLKKLDINYKTKNESLELNLRGNFNFLKNKVNFDYLKFNNNESSAEDLKYYKDIFESTFLGKYFLNNLNKRKIKKFILEIS